jgi:hypothetical protein
MKVFELIAQLLDLPPDNILAMDDTHGADWARLNAKVILAKGWRDGEPDLYNVGEVKSHKHLGKRNNLLSINLGDEL